VKKNPPHAGERYGRVVVVSLLTQRSARNQYVALCLCDCGRRANIEADRLRSRANVSCGCGSASHEPRADAAAITVASASEMGARRIEEGWSGSRGLYATCADLLLAEGRSAFRERWSRRAA
jgi:hypothetical protein